MIQLCQFRFVEPGFAAKAASSVLLGRRLATADHNLARKIFLDPGDLHARVLRAVVLIEEEDGQFHDLEVDHQVPKHHWMVRDESLLCENLVALLSQSVDELFVESTWW